MTRNVSVIVEVHPWRKIILRFSDVLHLLEVQESRCVVWIILIEPIGLLIHEHCIVFTCRFLGEAKKDSWALLCDTDDDEDGEDDDEDGAEGEAKLALMPAYVLARLLREQAKLLPACQTPDILFLIVIPSNTLLLPSILLLKGELCRT